MGKVLSLCVALGLAASAAAAGGHTQLERDTISVLRTLDIRGFDITKLSDAEMDEVISVSESGGSGSQKRDRVEDILKKAGAL